MSELTPQQQRIGDILAQHGRRRGVPNSAPARRKGKTPEGKLKTAIVDALNALPWCVAGTMARGVVKIGPRVISYGYMDGASDVLAFVAPAGRGVWLEVKVGRNRPRPNQDAFMERMRRYGVVAVPVWSVEEALAAVARARTVASA